MRVPQKHEKLFSTLITSLGMGFILSLAFTLIFPRDDGFFLQFGKSFLMGTGIAFPTTLFVGFVAEWVANTLPEKYKQPVSGLMVLFGIGGFVSLVFTIMLSGIDDDFFVRWRGSFLLAVSISFPTFLLVVGPISRKIVSRIVEGE